MQQKSEQNDKQSLLQLAEVILQKRYEILIQSVDKKTLEYFKVLKIRKGFIENENRFKQLSFDVVKFQVSLIINGTKCFEAFSFDSDGKRRFKETVQNFLISIIWKNSSSIRNSLTDTIIIKPYKQQHVIDQAILNIRQNYLIAKLIAGNEFTRQRLEEFLAVQEYKMFDQPSNCDNLFIQGLSSFDGKIVYIHESLNSDMSNRKYEEPEQEIQRAVTLIGYSKYFTYIVWLIEYLLMENLSRWSSNSHILSISPERNSNLRIEEQQMVGSGNFYLRKAHKYKNKLYSPFKLSYKIRHGFCHSMHPND